MSNLRRVVLPALFATAVGVANAGDSGFETPRDVRTVPLAATRERPAGTLTCRTFARVFVKVVEWEGDMGADQLSMVPLAAGAPPPRCRRAREPGERLVDLMNPDTSYGRFRAVAGDFVLFDFPDTVDGARAFGVFAAGSARQLFKAAVSADGDLEATLGDGALTLRYRRSLTAACSVLADGPACWRRTAADMGLDATRPPDCAGGYGSYMADASSVIAHDAETVITAVGATTTVRSPALSCLPAS